MSIYLAAVGAVLVFVAVLYGLRFLYGYRVQSGAIEIVLFQALPIYRLPVEQIEVIRKVSWNKTGSAIRLGNRLTRECVLIQKREGWFRRIVITPSDADEFISQVVASQQQPSGVPTK